MASPIFLDFIHDFDFFFFEDEQTYNTFHRELAQLQFQNHKSLHRF